MSLMMGDDTWKCDVCHCRRPDEKISVAVHHHTNGRGVEYQENVKFCNDDRDCENDAMLHGLRDLAAIEATMKFRNLRNEFEGVKSTAAIALVLVGAGALLVGLVVGRVALS